MSMVDVTEFERLLDAFLEQLLAYKAPRSVLTTSLMILEDCATPETYEVYESLRKGFDILAEEWVFNPDPNRNQTPEDIIQSLSMAAHYYEIRELLYYHYNASGAINFAHLNNLTKISLIDSSIARQFYSQANEAILGSLFMLTESVRSNSARIEHLLRGKPEFEAFQEKTEAWRLIENETEAKMPGYFNFLTDKEVSLGEYTYTDFLNVWKILMTKALYHRYWARANPSAGPSPINLPEKELVADLAIGSGIDPRRLQELLKDLSYGRHRDRLKPMNFPLIYDQSTGFHLFSPARVAPHEGPVGILRVVANRRPSLYLSNVANALAAGLNAHVAKQFREMGLLVSENVQLSRFSEDLPDIDVLAISVEPTLGFFVYVCEVKAQIPATWSKEHLKVTEDGGVKKGIRQVTDILRFLVTGTGLSFLRSFFPKEGLPHFGDKFVVAIKGLIVTSQSCGAFLRSPDVLIVDQRVLTRAVQRSDGDVVALNEFLRIASEADDGRYELHGVRFSMGSMEVEYDVVRLRSLLDFAQMKYKSVGLDQDLSAAFIADGRHPFDVLAGKD